MKNTLKNTQLKKVIQSSVLAIVCLFGNNSYAAMCRQPQQMDYQALMLATSVNKIETVKNLLGTYCYNFDFYKQNNLVPPFFLAHNVEMVKLFQSYHIDIIGYQDKLTDLDYLSSLLIEPINTTTPTSKEQDEFFSLLQKYDPTVTRKMLVNSQNITLEERKALLGYVAGLYKEGYVQKKDIFNNTALSYVILTGEDSLVNSTMGSTTTLPLFRKNKEGFAPIHLLFNAHYLGSTNEKVKLEHIEKLNDEIIQILDNSKVNLLNFRDMSFFEFAEMMKDGNPDFYNKLKAKFKFTVKDNPKNFTQYRQFAEENMRYPQRVKKILDDKQ